MMTQEEISDQLQLQRLTFLYCDAIDTGNYDALDDVFTADADIDYEAAGGIKGRYPEVKVWLKEALAHFGPGHHFVTNHLFEVNGEHAVGKVMCFSPMGWPRSMSAEDGRSVMFLTLWYRDRYIRTSAGWRICSRTELPWINYNAPLGLLPQAKTPFKA